MRQRKIAFGTIVLIGILLCIFYPNIQSTLVSSQHPTQTSIFAGPMDNKLMSTLLAPQANGQISREQAISLAELYCAQAHSPSKHNPTRIIASLMTETEARIRANDIKRVLSTTPVWFVSMNGEWRRAGPPAPDAGLISKNCTVTMDAQSGMWLVITNDGGRGILTR